MNGDKLGRTWNLAAGRGLGYEEHLARLPVLSLGPAGSALGHGEIMAPILVLHHGPAGSVLGHGDIQFDLRILITIQTVESAALYFSGGVAD